MTKKQILSTVIRWLVLTAFLATGLLRVAGTTRLPRLNAYLMVLAPSLLLMMLAIAPQIARDRQPADDGKQDTRARLALVVLFLVTILAATLDVARVHLSDNVPVVLSIIAIVMFIAASAMQAWAMSVNSFYSPVIHIQTEREHSLVTRGPYRIVRHPAYFANIILVPASALAIGCWIALIPAVFFCAITVWRARREDAFLKQNLAGYVDYTKSVPGGVLPHLSLRHKNAD